MAGRGNEGRHRTGISPGQVHSEMARSGSAPRKPWETGEPGTRHHASARTGEWQPFPATRRKTRGELVRGSRRHNYPAQAARRPDPWEGCRVAGRARCVIKAADTRLAPRLRLATDRERRERQPKVNGAFEPRLLRGFPLWRARSTVYRGVFKLRTQSNGKSCLRNPSHSRGNPEARPNLIVRILYDNRHTG